MKIIIQDPFRESFSFGCIRPAFIFAEIVPDMKREIALIRQEYSKKKFTEKKALPDPFAQFTKWWKQALKSDITEVNAMTLATASADGWPLARIVLLKDYSEKGFVFFTNYNSIKGKHLAENPRVCLVFFWKELERQVRITGSVEKVSNEDNDEYFYSRPKESQIGAAASPQSQVIENREWLDENYKKLTIEHESKKPERPSHWGGYLVKPVIIEFWQGRPGRLHDRLQYSLKDDGTWKIERLAP